MRKWERRWLAPALLPRIYYALRVGLVSGAGAAFFLTSSTQQLLAGGILIPVLAIVVSNLTLGATIRSSMQALLGGLTGALLVMAFWGVTDFVHHPVVTGVQLMVGIFLINLLEQPPTFRKIGGAVIVIGLLLNFELVEEAEESVSGGQQVRFVFEILGSVAIGTTLALAGAVVLPYTAASDGQRRLLLLMHLAERVDGLLVAAFVVHGTPADSDKHCQLDAEVVHLDLQDLLSAVRTNLDRLHAALDMAGWEPLSAYSQRLRLIRGWAQCVVKLHRVASLATEVQRSFSGTEALALFARALNEPLRQLHQQVYCAIHVAVACNSTLKSIQVARTNLAKALDHWLKAYHHARVQVWVGSNVATSKEGQTTADQLRDVMTINAFLFTFIRSAQIVLATLDAILGIGSSAQHCDPLLDTYSLDGNHRGGLRRQPGQLDGKPLLGCWAACSKRLCVLATRLFTPRWRPPVQTAAACSMAALLVLIPSMQEKYPFAFWAPLTTVFVTGDTVGGSYKQSMLRWHGTVAGALYGYVVFTEAQGYSWLLAVLLGIWVALSTLVRMSPGKEYAGIVSGFTAAIIILGTLDDQGRAPQQVAIDRILLTSYGILIAVVISNTIFPQRARTLAHQGLLHALDLAAQSVHEITQLMHESLIQPRYQTHGSLVPLPLEKLASQRAAILESLEKATARLPSIFEEAAQEPSLWSADFAKGTYAKFVPLLWRLRLYARGLFLCLLWLSNRGSAGSKLALVETIVPTDIIDLLHTTMVLTLELARGVLLVWPPERRKLTYDARLPAAAIRLRRVARELESKLPEKMVPMLQSVRRGTFMLPDNVEVISVNTAMNCVLQMADTCCRLANRAYRLSNKHSAVSAVALNSYESLAETQPESLLISEV